jgi:hypothetical protein
MIFCNLLARSFVIIFNTLFRREMGLKSLAVVGLSHLGIRVMNEEFMLSKEIFSS